MNGRTRVRDLRLVPLAATVWMAALVCVFIPDIAWWAVIACLAIGVGMLWRAARTRGDGRGSGGLLAVAGITMAAAAMTVGFATPQRDAAAELDGRVIEVVAEVSSSSSVGTDGRLWFDARSTFAGTVGAPDPLSAPLRIGVEPMPGLDLGAVIKVMGEAMATDPGERAALVVFGTRIDVIQPAQGVYGVAAQVREDFVERATRLPEPGAGLLPGLAVGDTRAVSEELDAAMLASGLSHLTAVSGPNS